MPTKARITDPAILRQQDIERSLDALNHADVDYWLVADNILKWCPDVMGRKVEGTTEEEQDQLEQFAAQLRKPRRWCAELRKTAYVFPRGQRRSEVPFQQHRDLASLAVAGYHATILERISQAIAPGPRRRVPSTNLVKDITADVLRENGISAISQSKTPETNLINAIERYMNRLRSSAHDPNGNEADALAKLMNRSAREIRSMIL